MKIEKMANGHWRLSSPVVAPGMITPTLNGVPLDGLTSIPAPAHQVIYTAPILDGGRFVIEATADQERLSLRYWLENPPGELQSFGLRFEQIENVKTVLRSGYFSWDGSTYLEVEAPHTPTSINGYAMTQLLPYQGSGSVIIGFDRHDRFQHTFTYNLLTLPPTLTIETVWDQKASDRYESERLLIFEHAEVENALREWARLVAAASPTPPRLATPHLTGWCSWYNLYAYLTEENILDHLRGAAKAKNEDGLPLRVFQIDDGFTPEMGDWLAVKPQFPRGMKPLLDDIRAAGFIPGLWIAPFMVGNRSQLYQQHPDWVVKDRQTGQPIAHMQFYAEFRWHKRSEEYYILDTTHPDAFNYLRQVFRIWRQEWGCDYFKTDFMHFGSEYGADRAIYHQPGMTRIEIWRRVAEMIREEMGDAIWLGCGFPLFAAVGLVDGVRIGRDVGVEWSGGQSAQSLLRDQPTRNYANHILWQADPDCILLRQRFHHLTDHELAALAIHAGMNGGVVMTSDHLGELAPERIALFRLLLRENRAGCDFPQLGQNDPMLVQVRAQGDHYAVFIFNTSDRALQRTYPLAGLGLPENLYTADWHTGALSTLPIQQISLILPPHQGRLLFLSPAPFVAVPEQLP